MAKVNCDTLCEMHVDKSNLGPSAFVAVGDYTGGELWVHGQGALDAHNKWHVYDGNHAHCTVPFAAGLNL